MFNSFGNILLIHELVPDQNDLHDALAVDGAGDFFVLLYRFNDEVLLRVDGDVDRALELAEHLHGHLDMGRDGLALCLLYTSRCV